MGDALTPSQENYLAHIWHLMGSGIVRIVDIADTVGVKRASASRAVRQLTQLGMLRHERYGDIVFTAKGHAAAEYIVYREQCLQRFLVNVLQLPEKAAADEVCRMEHAISEAVLRRLDRLSNLVGASTEIQRALRQTMGRFGRRSKSRGAGLVGVRPHV